MIRHLSRPAALLTITMAVLLLASGALAVSEQRPATEFDGFVVPNDTLRPGQNVVAFDALAHLLPASSAWQQALDELGPGAEVYFDVATGEPALVKAAPVPFLPGSGNQLSADLLADQPAADFLADRTAAFLSAHSDLFPVAPGDLTLRKVEEVNRNLWVVTYHHLIDGVPVQGSRLTLVVGHGNLILWGSQNIFPLVAESAAPLLSQADAETVLRQYVGWDDSRDDLVAASERVYLVEAAGSSLLGDASPGRRHRLAWEVTFKRAGVRGTWMAHIDARSGEVLEFTDLVRYASARGGIEPKTWTDVEENRPLPFVELSTGGFTSVEGQYVNGGATTGTLDGERVLIADQCSGVGFPSVDSGGGGDIEFGTGPANPGGDADCTNNGVGQAGGAHNTHAARSAYYHISRFKDRVSKWLPSNGWLQSQHEVRVNINDVCNAYWSPVGGHNGFFQEGFYNSLHCYNTGEIAGIFLHELGHGMDQNDAQSTADGGTGEAYGDVFAMLGLHESCTGQEFWTQQCTGYGLPCTDCTSVRDADYAKHTDGGSPVTTPFTPANYTGVHCPGGLFGSGPCNKEVHCEAYPATGAIWDLAVRQLPGSMDQATAWWLVERDWMVGMDIATAMFNCNDTTFASDGCAATSWFMAMLAVDDDDGNLMNGTPHAADLFAAFDDHAIACGSSGDASNQNSSACPSLPTPVLSRTDGAGSITLNWSPSANGTAILRNHNGVGGGCDAGYHTIATVAGGTSSYMDTDIDPDQTYTYRVVTLGGAGGPEDNACYSALSNCADEAGADEIFSDGFESGDTTAWSAVIP